MTSDVFVAFSLNWNGFKFRYHSSTYLIIQLSGVGHERKFLNTRVRR